VRFKPGRNLAERSPLANTQKIVKKQSQIRIERLYKNPKSLKNTPKNAKKQQSTETKRIVNIKIQAR